MNLKEIRELLQLMTDHDLSEIEIEKEGMRIKLKKGADGILTQHVTSSAPAVMSAPSAGAAPVQASVAPAGDPNVYIVRSPMVGTFYAAPAPDQPPYASVGQQIREGDVLCIVEAMKLMNEIKSDKAGTILEVMVQNGQAVEFDQPLFKFKVG